MMGAAIDAEAPDGRHRQQERQLQRQRHGREPRRQSRQGQQCGADRRRMASLPLTADESALRCRIVLHLRQCGFVVGEDGSVRLPRGADTGEAYRRVQTAARREQMARRGAAAMLSGRAYDDAKRLCPDGSEIDPGRIDLEIRMLPRAGPGPAKSGDARTAALFHWWNIAWWSMPWQQSYGRRLRYFLWDVHHDAPFGLVVLQSPLLRMAARDARLGIDGSNAEACANMSMSAQRVGALPPYNMLIGGKMAALSLVCNEVRAEYAARYGGGRRTVMRGREIDPRLMCVTTTSAFGRSSMYDRLTYRGRPAGEMIGWTRGNGTFHLPADAARGLYGVLERRGIRASTTYGNGPSAKVRLCGEALAMLGLGGLQVHGLRRAVYLFEAAANVREVMGDGAEPLWHDRPFAGAAEWWMERWCRGRAARCDDWRRFRAGEFFDGLRKEVEAAAAAWP